MSEIFHFGDCELDAGRYELRRDGAPLSVEPQVFDLLVYLLRNRDRVVSKDEVFEAVWDGRIVSEATLSSRINAARTAVGDDGKAQAVIRTIPRRGFRFVADVALAGGAASPELAATGNAVKQDIRFHKTADGTSLAYSTLGEGPALVKAANWMNHLEFEVNNPPWDHFWRALSAGHRLIRYDQRGNGLSDRDVADISFEAFVGDLESLVDALGLERFALLGISQGCGISVAYAARHPGRVSHLVLYGGYAQGWRRRGDAEEIARGEAFTTLIEQGWGQESPTYRQLFTSMFMPDAGPDRMAAFNELERLSVTAAGAARYHEIFGVIDVGEWLPRVAAKTLVLNCREDARVPFAQGKALAAGIADARFVPLESRNHILLPDEPAWARFIDEIGGFLAED